MKLASLKVNNFRSISESDDFNFNQRTIIIGKNNEGKSNYLKSINIALSIILNKRRAELMLRRNNSYIYRNELISWERDYPISLKNKKKPKPILFTIKFDLSDEDVYYIRELTSKAINKSIFISIQVHKSEIHFDVYYMKNKKIYFKTNADKEKITEYIAKKINFVYIPAVRTEIDSMHVINSIILDRLEELYEKQEYKEAIKTINEMKQELLNKISSELKSNLVTFLPKLKNIELKQKDTDRYEGYERNNISIVLDDGTATEISFKGDGVKSLVTLALLHTSSKRTENTIIAIEEPESHLHSGAAHELKSILDQISDSNQIIITTHNPIFIDRFSFANNILIDDGKIKKISNIKDLRKVLGIKMSDNLISCENILLVEGETDKIILQYFLNLINNDIGKAISTGKLMIMNSGGVSHFSQYANFYKNALCNVVAIADNDQEAKSNLDKLRTNNILEHNDIFCIDNILSNESEIENIFEHDIIKEYFSGSEIFPEFNFNKYRASNKKFSEELKTQWESSGKIDSENAIKKIKFDFANYVIKKDSSNCIKEKNLTILNHVITRVLNNSTS